MREILASAVAIMYTKKDTMQKRWFWELDSNSSFNQSGRRMIRSSDARRQSYLHQLELKNQVMREDRSRRLVALGSEWFRLQPTRGLLAQKLFAENDLIDGLCIAFTKIYNKMYRAKKVAWRTGQQLVIQPVNVCKQAWFISRGFQKCFMFGPLL